MPLIFLYLHLHQPRRLRRLTAFDAGKGYFDAALECGRLLHSARTTYLPALEVLRSLIPRFEGRLRARIWLSGVLIEQLEQYSLETLDALSRLIETGGVELLAESYYHSLAFLYSPAEFAEQVEMHARRVRAVFGREPGRQEKRGGQLATATRQSVRRRGGALDDALHVVVDDAAGPSLIGALVEDLLSGADAKGTSTLRGHSSFVGWLAARGDYSDWLRGTLQFDALHSVYALESRVKAAKDPSLLHTWRCLQASDHFAGMAVDPAADGGAGGQASGEARWVVAPPGDSVPNGYDAYLYFMTALDHLAGSVTRSQPPRRP